LRSRHSLLALDNLAEAVDRILAAPAPLRRPFIVADPEPLTIGEIVAALRHGLGRRAGLFYVPRPVLKAALRAGGHSGNLETLFGSLVADTSALTRLDWLPPVATQHGLAAFARNGTH
jgi:nucleoside-diphosphate-sugar epimerase